MASSITIRVEFSKPLRDPQGATEALAEHLAGAFRVGDLPWRTTANDGGQAQVVDVSAWPTRGS